MSWENILKKDDWFNNYGVFPSSEDFFDIFDTYQIILDNAHMRLLMKDKHGVSLSLMQKEKTNNLLDEAEQQLEKLKLLDELDGSEVQFKETMDKIYSYL